MNSRMQHYMAAIAATVKTAVSLSSSFMQLLRRFMWVERWKLDAILAMGSSPWKNYQRQFALVYLMPIS
jgi:hypothetical protein